MNFKHYIPALFLLLAGCSKPSDEIIIATAANVQYVMQDIKKEFEKETGKPVEIVVSSSGKLTTQIREGAPFDVFVSADMKYPQEIYEKGGSEEAPRVYAYGELVLWAKDIPAAELSSEILMSEKIKKIAIPNPRFAPYGEAAIQVLEKQKSYADIKNNISSGSVEAGFNALSIVLSPEMKGKGNWVVVDSSLYQPIAQGAILLRHSENSPKKKTSEEFYNFLYSEKAKEIFKKYGYR
jgi:molybdate transport system substrate-binding protein